MQGQTKLLVQLEMAHRDERRAMELKVKQATKECVLEHPFPTLPGFASRVMPHSFTLQAGNLGLMKKLTKQGTRKDAKMVAF